MNNLTGKASALVKKFNRSTFLQEALVKSQEILGMIPSKKLIQDVDTRWDSEFEQLSRICELMPALKSVAHNTSQDMFTDHDYKMMKLVSYVLTI
jgi:hypothetical protein